MPVVVFVSVNGLKTAYLVCLLDIEDYVVLLEDKTENVLSETEIQLVFLRLYLPLSGQVPENLVDVGPFRDFDREISSA